MIRTLALVALLSICACGSGSIDADSAEEDASLEFIEVGNTGPQASLTLINLTNFTAISELNTSNNFTSTPGLALPTNDRIVGGRRISITEAPWQVAVIQSRIFICGGSIITSYYVLTAAHCVYGKMRARHAVRAGSDSFKQGGQLRIVDRIGYHGRYNRKTGANDIALLRTRRPFVFNSKVRPVPLSTSDSEPNSYFVSGWGTLRGGSRRPTKYLRGVNVFPVKRATCANAYRGKIPITDKQICAMAPQKDACKGDSGGALTSGGTQYGIVSSGFGCAQPKYPGVYMQVFKYRKWIMSVRQYLDS